MDEIRGLLWSGSINVQITAKPSLLIAGVGQNEGSINLRVPRNTYLPISLPLIKNLLKDFLRVDLDDKSRFVWFEFENVPLYWNYPVGVLFDSMVGLNPSERQHKDTPLSLYIWKIELSCGTQVPTGVIPLVGGLEQIRSYWMHQWKQACFILNGSAKQMMSLSMQDSQKFWESITKRDRESFELISARIVPSRPRYIPLIIHQSLPEMKIMQPVAVPSKKSEDKQKIIDVLHSHFSGYLENSGGPLIKVVCCGIEIPLNANLYETYLRFINLDGFLHISICLLTANELEG